jgi:hypothetical protein
MSICLPDTAYVFSHLQEGCFYSDLDPEPYLWEPDENAAMTLLLACQERYNQDGEIYLYELPEHHLQEIFYTQVGNVFPLPETTNFSTIRLYYQGREVVYCSKMHRALKIAESQCGIRFTCNVHHLHGRQKRKEAWCSQESYPIPDRHVTLKYQDRVRPKILFSIDVIIQANRGLSRRGKIK